jgi:predicted ester cyclase
VTKTALAELYRAYIACLNRQDWPNLHKFVHADVRHNGRPFGLAGYRAMLERDFAEIPETPANNLERRRPQAHPLNQDDSQLTLG